MSERKVDLVIGANYGDEGKGTITARIASQNPNGKILNVLTNGGPQRGHSVCSNGRTHIFHHFGSATPFRATSLFDKDFILNPMVFREEYDVLVSESIAPPVPIRDPQCKWTTPFDMMFNQMESALHWKGTCGMGIWATLCRYAEMPGDKPAFDQFALSPHVCKVEYLRKIKQYYESKLDVSIFSEYMEPWNSPYLIDHFIEDCTFMFENTLVLNPSTLNDYSHIILENGQGLLLNDNGNDDPERTPSQTGSDAAFGFLKLIPGIDYLNVHYVTRPYMTRHGSSRFVPEKVDMDLDLESETNRYNFWQRELLYSNLDLNQLKSTIDADKRKWSKSGNISFTIDVTHCDELDRSRQFREIFRNENCLKFHDNRSV